MGVPKHDHCRTLSRDACLERITGAVRVNDVMDKDFAAIRLEDTRFREMKTWVIRISPNGDDGRNLLQFEKDHRHADVTAVEDMVHPRE